MNDQENNTNIFDNLSEESSESDTCSEQVASFSEELQKNLNLKAAECQGLNDKYLRLAAEFDNFKRLAQRDQRDQIKFGNEQILRELLPTVDNLDRAIKSTHTNGVNDALTQGVELTLKQLLGVLMKFGVKPVDSVGQPFDPATQQAVAQVASNSVPEHHVVEEFQKGYLLHDRILRPAMVTVSTGAADTA
ncbi:MAG: nucleotide exchange factor GrpE [Nitrospiraceae bacterium]